MQRIGEDVSEKLDIIPAKLFVHRHIYGKWAWARSHHDPQPGVIYQFCLGRGSQYPLAFPGCKGPPYPEPAWNGTLITDQYAAYNALLDAKVYPHRKSAVRAAHARRRFEELSPRGHRAGAVATEALQRWKRPPFHAATPQSVVRQCLRADHQVSKGVCPVRKGLELLGGGDELAALGLAQMRQPRSQAADR
jgi:hypothetical protein